MSFSIFPSSAKRILVIEEDKLMRDFLEIALANGGFQVVTAGDGNAAVDLTRLVHSDLMITDRIMQGMAGVKIVASACVQAGSQRDFLPLAKSLRTSAILRKPFARETLTTTVCSVISQEARP